MENTNSNIIEEIFIESVFDIRDDHNNYTDEDILTELTNLLEELKGDPKFIDKFEEALQDKRLELGYCPYCGTKLKTHTYKEYHTEISEMGYTPYEKLGYTYCSYCEYKDND